jgi:hypothetical protein
MTRSALRSLLPVVLLAAGCLPYTVASTARPVPKGEHVQTGTLYFIPNGLDREGDSAAVPLRGVDAEVRYGIDARADWGVRLTSGSGFVLSYKRLLGEPSPRGAAVALEGSGGIVNFGEHAMVGVTLLASGQESAQLTPYGGLRVMQVAPLSRGAVHDAPSVGAFVGARIGRRDHGVSPELGIFHDPSALHIRRGNLLFVPSVSIHGAELLRAIGRIGRAMPAGW